MALDRPTARVSGDILDADGNVDIQDVGGRARVTAQNGMVVLSINASTDLHDIDSTMEMTPTRALALSMALMDAAGKAAR